MTGSADGSCLCSQAQRSRRSACAHQLPTMRGWLLAQSHTLEARLKIISRNVPPSHSSWRMYSRQSWEACQHVHIHIRGAVRWRWAGKDGGRCRQCCWRRVHVAELMGCHGPLPACLPARLPAYPPACAPLVSSNARLYTYMHAGMNVTGLLMFVPVCPGAPTCSGTCTNPRGPYAWCVP